MKVEEFIFAESGGVPNNPRLPVLVYRQAIDVTENAATRIEERFRANGWLGLWRNGVFARHHYHCGAHEVLGIAEGRARLLIGGPVAGKSGSQPATSFSFPREPATAATRRAPTSSLSAVIRRSNTPVSKAAPRLRMTVSRSTRCRCLASTRFSAQRGQPSSSGTPQCMHGADG